MTYSLSKAAGKRSASVARLSVLGAVERMSRCESRLTAARDSRRREESNAADCKKLSLRGTRTLHAGDHLKAAVGMLPSDAHARLNLAMNLEQSGVTAVAEPLTSSVMTLDAEANRGSGPQSSA